jgi:hypothetical protein
MKMAICFSFPEVRPSKAYSPECHSMVNSVTGRQCRYNVILRHFRVKIFAVKRNNYYIFRVCFVALVIRHAMRMRGIILSLAVCPAVAIFVHIVSVLVRLSEKKLLNTHVFVFLYNCCLTHLSF